MQFEWIKHAWNISSQEGALGMAGVDGVGLWGVLTHRGWLLRARHKINFTNETPPHAPSPPHPLLVTDRDWYSTGSTPALIRLHMQIVWASCHGIILNSLGIVQVLAACLAGGCSLFTGAPHNMMTVFLDSSLFLLFVSWSLPFFFNS